MDPSSASCVGPEASRVWHGRTIGNSLLHIRQTDILSISAPRVWNSLPYPLKHSADNRPHFRKELKSLCLEIPLRNIEEWTYLLIYILSGHFCIREQCHLDSFPPFFKNVLQRTWFNQHTFCKSLKEIHYTLAFHRQISTNFNSFQIPNPKFILFANFLFQA